MTLLAKLHHRLKQQDGVHLSIRLYMFTLRMDDRVRSCYYELVRSFLLKEFVESSSLNARRCSIEVTECKQKRLRQLLEDHKNIHMNNSSRHNFKNSFNGMGQPNPVAALTNGVARHRKGSGMQLGRDQKIDQTRAVDERWDWNDFPGPLAGTEKYTICSTCWMIYAVIRTLFHDHFARFIDKFSWSSLGIRGNCFLLGRLVIHAAIDERSAILFSGFHLIWRSLLTFEKRNFRLTMINFLLHTDRDVERFHRIIENDCDEVPIGRSSQSTLTKCHIGPSYNRSRRASDDVTATPVVEPPASLNELLLRHTMCYPVYYGRRIFFKLRPNRTQEARVKLSDQVAKSFIFATSVFLLLITILVPYGLFYIAADRRYLATFPGCYKMLDELYSSGQLPFFSVSARNHHLLAGCVDAIENIFIWMDSFLAVTHGTILCYLFNHDLLLYWSSLQVKLELLLERVRQRSPFYRWYSEPTSDNDLDNSNSNEPLELDWPTTTVAPTLDWRLENEIHELQFEVMDFFHEIERVDAIMSDVLTATIFIWLSGCAMLFYNFILEHTAIPSIILAVMSAGFIVFTVVSHYLLLLRRCCLTSYRTLCSLMAHDVGEKRNLLKSMDFFIEMNGISYTLARSYPYKPTTFLTIVGYTISCLLMITTLFSHENNSHEPSRVLENNMRRPVAPAPIEPSNLFERLLRELAIS